jgi:ADP-heptose:LPS heptosyltransferase
MELMSQVRMVPYDVGVMGADVLDSSKTVLRVTRPAGLGDILMCTPALREYKRMHPDHEIHFYSGYAELVAGIPYLDSVFPPSECPPDTLLLSYNHAVYKQRHFARAIGDALGVIVTDVRPDCPVRTDLVHGFESGWRELPKPHILVQRRASEWTMNRNWPDELWEKLIPELLNVGTVIEIGQTTRESPSLRAKNYLDLRNVSSLELVASIAAADVLVGPDSGPVHVAAAVGTPAVVIMGGYLLPENTAYPNNIIFHTPLPCSPCFLREPCPHNLNCLWQIPVDEVLNAVVRSWTESKGSLQDDCTSLDVLTDQRGKWNAQRP